MAETLIQSITKTTEGKRLYEQERAILEVTELICEIWGLRAFLARNSRRNWGRQKATLPNCLTAIPT